MQCNLTLELPFFTSEFLIAVTSTGHQAVAVRRDREAQLRLGFPAADRRGRREAAGVPERRPQVLRRDEDPNLQAGRVRGQGAQALVQDEPLRQMVSGSLRRGVI